MPKPWTTTHERARVEITNGMKPVHPGAILRDEIKAAALPSRALAPVSYSAVSRDARNSPALSENPLCSHLLPIQDLLAARVNSTLTN